MNKTIAIAVAATLALAASGIALGDRDEGRGEGGEAGGSLAAPPNALYRSECAACHLAYPPALLPAGAWARVMGGLSSHYGDDASLEPAAVTELLAYLTANAADSSPRLRAQAFAAVPIANDRPPRITETVYFKREHHEIPARLVSGNPQVKGFSACQACHREAEQGRFDEDGVRIPGVGRWDD
jgi:hypothetical protein